MNIWTIPASAVFSNTGISQCQSVLEHLCLLGSSVFSNNCTISSIFIVPTQEQCVGICNVLKHLGNGSMCTVLKHLDCPHICSIFRAGISELLQLSPTTCSFSVSATFWTTVSKKKRIIPSIFSVPKHLAIPAVAVFKHLDNPSICFHFKHLNSPLVYSVLKPLEYFC